MSESADWSPAHWAAPAHDFASARRHYDAHVGRSYSDAKAVGKQHSDLVPVSLSTDSPAPLVILSDVTGSMGEWPATMFSKLPYLELEGQEYLGKGMEISWGAVGDAYVDDYPWQVRPFTKGTDLKKRLEELVIEKGGGGQTTESYELGALYCARNIAIPKAITPICIFIGDEQPYEFVDKEQASAKAHIMLQSRLSTREAFAELKEKFAVYLIRKPYSVASGNTMSDLDHRIFSTWAELLGADHISDLPEAGRVVDVIFGILAKETGRIDYFRKEIEGRQKPNQIATVYKSLASIHQLPAPKDSSKTGRSIMKRDEDGTTSVPLL